MLAATTLLSGQAVAWVDATRTLDPRDWVTVDPTGSDALWVVRPGEASRAPWCADLLLRTGSFALVVLDGAPVLPRAVAVRLSQLTRDADASLLLLGEGSRASEIGGALRLVLKRRDPRTGGSVLATVEKGGPHQHIPLQLEVGHGRDIARRVCAHPEIPDRRGVARSARRPWAPSGNGVDTGNDAQRSEHPVTWGGLGVGSHDLYGTDLPGHPARLAAGLDEPGDRLGSDRFEDTDRLRLDRELDRRTRDWTTYRGRRRAAESGFGRRGRRELARERTGALLGSGGGQSAPRKERPDPAPAAAPPALG
jgi:hypothetical protein